MRQILAKTNLIVMIDDPVISSNLEEFLLQFQSGLTMGSKTSGLMVPQGSLLLTSNTDVTQRYYKHNTLVYQYHSLMIF